jgi:hypothetical protein
MEITVFPEFLVCIVHLQVLRCAQCSAEVWRLCDKNRAEMGQM